MKKECKKPTESKAAKLIKGIMDSGITLEDMMQEAEKHGIKLKFSVQPDEVQKVTADIKKETARLKAENDAFEQEFMDARTGNIADDPINPAHYQDGGIETIDFLQAKSTPEEFEGYCRLNAMKYLSRAGKKANTPADDDKKKAVWYLNRSLGQKVGHMAILHAQQDKRYFAIGDYVNSVYGGKVTLTGKVTSYDVDGTYTGVNYYDKNGKEVRGRLLTKYLVKVSKEEVLKQQTATALALTLNDWNDVETKTEETNMNYLYEAITVYKKDEIEEINVEHIIANNDESARMIVTRKLDVEWDAAYTTIIIKKLDILRQP